jgi:hypothetical protein
VDFEPRKASFQNALQLIILEQNFEQGESTNLTTVEDQDSRDVVHALDIAHDWLEVGDYL